jgi:predicted alpha/beta-fold hydrolase
VDDLTHRPRVRGLPPPPAPFRIAPWASGPHAQTLIARVLRSPGGPPFERERLQTEDDDFLDIDWGPDPADDAPVVLVLHGLEGSSRRRYVRNVCRALLRHGIRPVAMNLRGCSGEPNRSLRFYHSGETSDPTLILRTIRARYPGRPVGAMGFSLGGNILLKLLGERSDGGESLLDAAVAMSVPYDLAAGCDELERTRMGKLYSAYFLRSLRSKVAAKRERLAAILDIDAVWAARTIRDFDEHVTAPLNGFSGASGYYDACSSIRFLSTVRVPTLLLHARDDPFLPVRAIPDEEARENPMLVWSLQEAGGHVGFLEGAPWAPRFWADEASAGFLAHTLRLR